MHYHRALDPAFAEARYHSAPLLHSRCNATRTESRTRSCSLSPQPRRPPKPAISGSSRIAQGQCHMHMKHHADYHTRLLTESSASPLPKPAISGSGSPRSRCFSSISSSSSQPYSKAQKFLLSTSMQSRTAVGGGPAASRASTAALPSPVANARLTISTLTRDKSLTQFI